MLTLLSALVLTSAMGHPDWCDWVPLSSQQQVSQCKGYVYPSMNSSSSCASWCQWISGASWGATSDCSDCYNLYSKHYKNHRSASSLQGCQDNCRWLSRPAWGRYPNCKSCKDDSVPLIILPMAFNQISKTEQPVSGLKLKTVQAQKPDWCKWVPVGSLRYVDECSVSTASDGVEGCKTWCVWSPTSWRYMPECRRCSTEMLPTAVGDGCEDWCRWVSRPAWLDGPDCSNCDRDQREGQNTTDTTGDSGDTDTKLP